MIQPIRRPVLQWCAKPSSARLAGGGKGGPIRVPRMIVVEVLSVMFRIENDDDPTPIADGPLAGNIFGLQALDRRGNVVFGDVVREEVVSGVVSCG